MSDNTSNTPDHPNYIPVELLPEGWWIYTVRELHKNPNEDQQIALENLSGAFAANYMVMLMKGMVTDKNKKQASGLGKSINEAFKQALSQILEQQ